MAAEAKRGCGYRKFGGIYIVCDPIGVSCDRLPFELTVCSHCGEGYKRSRAYRWIKPVTMLGGNHHPVDGTTCDCTPGYCPVCHPVSIFSGGTAGLLWVGEKYYTPAEFRAEVNEMGLSKRIPAVPKDFKVGETWIFMAHIKAIESTHFALDDPDEPIYKPGIFMAVKPQRIERIVKQTEFNIFEMVNKDYEVDSWLKSDGDHEAKEIFKRLKRDVDRGITLVPLPDGDPDHE